MKVKTTVKAGCHGGTNTFEQSGPVNIAIVNQHP